MIPKALFAFGRRIFFDAFHIEVYPPPTQFIHYFAEPFYPFEVLFQFLGVDKEFRVVSCVHQKTFQAGDCVNRIIFIRFK